MTSENRNSRKSQPDDWPIGKTHCAKRTLSTRNEERCNFSWISSGPARLLLSVSRSFPIPPARLPVVRPRLPSFPSFSLPALRSCGVFVSPTRRTDSSFAGTIRVVSVRAEACKQVRWMHSMHSTGLSSSSSITRRPLLHLLRACVLPSILPLPLSIYLSIYLSPRSRSLRVLRVCLVVSRSPSFTLASFFYFGARCNRAFSMKTYGFLSEESSPAIVLPDAADDRNLASETRHRTISRITMSPRSSHASCAR